MKKTTCWEMLGACDEVITGKTPEDMDLNSKKHVMEMVHSGDAAHNAAIEDMMRLSHEEQKSWYENFINNFNSLPEA